MSGAVIQKEQPTRAQISVLLLSPAVTVRIAFARWQKYFYMTTTPSVQNSGWPCVKTDVHSFVDAKGFKEIASKHNGKMFHSTEFKLPDCVPLKQKDITKAYKPVGPLSNQRSASATAWLLEHRSTGFRHAELAWLGARLQRYRLVPYSGILNGSGLNL